jgi:hypothetical protein
VEEVVKGEASYAEIVQAVAFDQGFWAPIINLLYLLF